VLTNLLVCVYHSIVNYEIMINHSGSVSQGYGRVNCPDDGLRLLASLIARDLLTKREDNTNKKNGRKVSNPQILESCR